MDDEKEKPVYNSGDLITCVTLAFFLGLILGGYLGDYYGSYEELRRLTDKHSAEAKP